MTIPFPVKIKIKVRGDGLVSLPRVKIRGRQDSGSSPGFQSGFE
jgi:hypothetical protein